MNISIVIVNYNTRDLLLSCLKSISKFFPSKTEIVVIDNASSDDSVQALKKPYPQVKIIKNVSNLGFAKACNQGIKVAQGALIFLVNSDIEFVDRSFEKAVEYLEENPDCGLVGPKLLNTDGSLQPSAFAQFPNFATTLAENGLTGQIMNKLLPDMKRPGKYLYSNSSHEKTLRPAHVGGALMIFKKKVWERVDGLDERFFMFREETDFCKKISDRGLEIIYLPTFSVFHHQITSIKIQGLHKKLRLYFRSVYLYHAKYYGRISQIILYLLNTLKFAINLLFYVIFVTILKVLMLKKIAGKLNWYLLYNYLSLRVHLLI